MAAPKRVKDYLNAQGISAVEWAEQHGYNPRTVRAVLDGHLKCTRGISHKIAVELGLKPDPNKRKPGAKAPDPLPVAKAA